jgi:outer membrane putative beta-barrel porin/alpha-amylase
MWGVVSRVSRGKVAFSSKVFSLDMTALALAAEPSGQVPKKAPAPSDYWSGLNVGAHLGHAWGRADVSASEVGGGVPRANIPPVPSRSIPTARCLACAAIAAVISAGAAAADPRPAAGIQDNSHIVEEAYNQQAGVVQHIQTLQRQRDGWQYTFAQEFPLGSQDHQISYAVPYSWVRNDMSERVDGAGDVFLNYRPQIWTETDTRPAFAPRVSLILPSGSQTKGLGDGSAGLQFNAPFSKIVSDRVTLHANAGLTRLFDVDGHQPTSYRLGGSAIYAVNRDFNLMLETIAEWEQTVNADRLLEREFSYTISPGFRYALNYPQLADLQVVMGGAAPIRFTQGKSTDYGLLLYLSFEHNFLDKTEPEKKPPNQFLKPAHNGRLPAHHQSGLRP